ncbi:MAG: endonuclease III domain-containing protein [Oligoflexia bacterium]|nr:endonuclease III domain-containing protein [Oligoflexia bacterium]
MLQLYGPQGWWPLISKGGYHCGDYTVPDHWQQRFEIGVGAILTQNTSWKQVEKALVALHQLQMLNHPQTLLDADCQIIETAIKSAGYFRQKCKKLKIFSDFFLQHHRHIPSLSPRREELLSLWGIGPETADSILLYAYGVPIFVIDAYTKRIFTFLGMYKEALGYNQQQELFMNNLKSETILYQEYHALIVLHAKKYYSVKPYGSECPLRDMVQQL